MQALVDAGLLHAIGGAALAPGRVLPSRGANIADAYTAAQTQGVSEPAHQISCGLRQSRSVFPALAAAGSGPYWTLNKLEFSLI